MIDPNIHQRKYWSVNSSFYLKQVWGDDRGRDIMGRKLLKR